VANGSHGIRQVRRTRKHTRPLDVTQIPRLPSGVELPMRFGAQLVTPRRPGAIRGGEPTPTRVQSRLTPMRLPNGSVKPCSPYLESCPRTAPFGKGALWTLT
jgi:hypothetical protein